MDALSNKSRSRRSHPSLGALHITPMTSDPLVGSPFIDDDDDPDSSRRRSYLASRSLPQTPSILSRSNSRSNSRVRGYSGSGHRSAKSALALTSLDDGTVFGRPASGDHGVGAYTYSGTKTPRGERPKSAIASGRQTPARVRIARGESTDFLLRTASMLVENASESKGQGWISKRNSSTSLANYEMDGGRSPDDREKEKGYPADDEWSRRDGSGPASRRESRRNSISQPGSRWGSRRGSRAMMAGAGWRTPGASTPRSGYFEEMGLDLADDGTERDWSDGEGEETIDETELKRLLRRRVGGFLEDVFGGWFDFRGEDAEQTDDDVPEDEYDKAKDVDASAQARREKRQRFAGIKKNDIVEVKPASETGGTFADAKWFLGLARNVLV